MRKFSPFFVILAAACSAAPVSYYGMAPPGREDAYRCAVAQLNIMGYTIEDGNSDVFTGNTYHDVLTATAFDNPATGETNLRVVATRIADQDVAMGVGGSEDAAERGEDVLPPSDSGKTDAQALLMNCGVSNVTGPPPDQDEYALSGAPAPQDIRLRGGRASAGER